MPLPPFRFDGAHAVVTGAASGIGEQLAHRLADRGAHLLLVDVDAERLAAVADHVARGRDVTVRTEVADLADRDAVDALAARVLGLWPRVDLLVNNAGVAVGGRFTDLTAAEFDRVIAVNFAAPVALCRGLLCGGALGRGAHVVNVSSVFGLLAPPGQSAYAASKFALRGFTEALRHELEPLGVGVTSVHPGGVRTRIAASARPATALDPRQAAEDLAAFERLLTYPPERAATRILDGVRRRRGRVLVAPSAVAGDLLVRLLPGRYWDVVRRLVPAAGRATGRAPEAAGPEG
ncbi:SDR family NAD(P)-dependent oxidoreductase [Aquipuribacter sp. SD81]|uniref:SDR family NAD(P)-dependent oxidoreductase n=1 Tax=Aquipuribacter sp. SD81 TaxID=3127703 RepID=UPI00301773B4